MQRNGGTVGKEEHRYSRHKGIEEPRNSRCTGTDEQWEQRNDRTVDREKKKNSMCRAEKGRTRGTEVKRGSTGAAKQGNSK